MKNLRSAQQARSSIFLLARHAPLSIAGSGRSSMRRAPWKCNVDIYRDGIDPIFELLRWLPSLRNLKPRIASPARIALTTLGISAR